MGVHMDPKIREFFTIIDTTRDYEILSGPYRSKKEIFGDCPLCFKIYVVWENIDENYIQLAEEIEKKGYSIILLTGVRNNFIKRSELEWNEYSGGILIVDNDQKPIGVILAHETGPEIFLSGSSLGVILGYIVGGIIGNRADALLVLFVKWLWKIINGLSETEDGKEIWQYKWDITIRRPKGREIKLGEFDEIFASLQLQESALLTELKTVEPKIKKLGKLKIKTADETTEYDQAISKKNLIKNDMRTIRSRMIDAMQRINDLE